MHCLSRIDRRIGKLEALLVVLEPGQRDEEAYRQVWFRAELLGQGAAQEDTPSRVDCGGWRGLVQSKETKMDKEPVIKKLSDVLKPYFYHGVLWIPYPNDPAPAGDFLPIEFTKEDPEGFRIYGLEPPKTDEMDEQNLAYIAELRTYAQKLFKVAGINIEKLFEVVA